MPFMESFELGPFSVDAAGRFIRHVRMCRPPSVSAGVDRVVRAHLVQRDTLDGRLFIQCSLGRIPSTASDPATRVACFKMLRKVLGALPDTWTPRLLPDHQPQLEVETSVTLPITVTNLVTELTLFLLALSPYLELMDQAGLGRVSAAS